MKLLVLLPFLLLEGIDIKDFFDYGAGAFGKEETNLFGRLGFNIEDMKKLSVWEV